MEITLLKEEDVWGDSALEVIQAYGTRTGISDAAIVLGTFVGYGSRNSAGVIRMCLDSIFPRRRQSLRCGGFW